MAPNEPKIINVPDFWALARKSARRFLGLDYDGTLAPFAVDRTSAHPLPGVVELLGKLSGFGKTFVAIVSGRAISEVMSLVGDPGVTFVGSHGFEFKYPGGEIVATRPGQRQADGLESARRVASRSELGHLVEIKTASVALHTRPLDAERAARAESLILPIWSDIASSSDLYCRRFNGGIEILARGVNKGHAVSKLIGETGADFAVYVGDDTTDEDVFNCLTGRGIGIRVGEPETPTAADGLLADCEAVREFLKAWLSVDSG